jgi:hypothetical protein
MYINNTNLNFNMGGAQPPQFGTGNCGCPGEMGMVPTQLLQSMQSMAGSAMNMGFLGSGGMMPGGFPPTISPGFGNGGRGDSKKLAKAIKGLTKFLGGQAKKGKGQKKNGKKKKG